ncbi:hypothetical protein G5B47_16325 [Paenibacillus sp. 7124]|uniref:Uncharacterized protein n=1 Tax=Paenibacillus apii TaxID=1850370 RepID=A0A6M1PPB4_9BACL|nr:hypothetical protein [Paenibacillus apii]NGM83985.1 hypothetical protein [Paenibacillus apii]NJJ40519.1 hypothetical protein [Paenibacillus apii]
MEPVNPDKKKQAGSGDAFQNGVTDWGGSDGFSLLNSAADAPGETLRSPEAGQETGDTAGGSCE